MPIYNKLVRDKIPLVIRKTGKTFTTRTLDDTEYIQELNKKSYEELEEYIQASTKEDAIEELADLLEILHAFAATHGATMEEVEAVRKQKSEKRGGFQEKIYLIEVEDE